MATRSENGSIIVMILETRCFSIIDLFTQSCLFQVLRQKWNLYLSFRFKFVS